MKGKCKWCGITTELSRKHLCHTCGQESVHAWFNELARAKQKFDAFCRKKEKACKKGN